MPWGQVAARLQGLRQPVASLPAVVEGALSPAAEMEAPEEREDQPQGQGARQERTAAPRPKEKVQAPAAAEEGASLLGN